MDISAIATQLGAFLAPVLPYLVKGGEKIAEQVGEATWHKAQQIWQRLTGQVEQAAALETAAGDLIALPEDEDARAAFRLQLKKCLSGDEELAAELAKLLEDLPSTTNRAEVHGGGAVAQDSSVAAGERGVAIGGDVKGSVIVTGDGNK